MYKSFYIKLVLLIFLVIDFSTSDASHIVGGVMNYKYLGNDNFEVSLFVYRDCRRANPGATLDPEAIIWIYDKDINDTIGVRLFPIPFDSLLADEIQDPCALIQPDECVDWTKYVGIINLPPNGNGYTIYYQRCCRNNSILNITTDPNFGQITWGATYFIDIPPSENGLHINNSSPVLLNYPPVYICVGKPIEYDHSAIDAEGDSITYKLCTPFTGASIFDPRNEGTLEPPPFDTIEWQNPFDLSNLLGGVPLSINNNSGFLTGTPNTQGQFVVGVCIEEFRNGNLISKTIRDFQFNVVNCGLQIISSFFAPDLQCNSLTVNFSNQSSGADRYIWNFGDGETSTEQNPSHTYADTGIYFVTLTSIKGDTCIASFTKEVSVQYKRIEADFIFSDSFCIKQGDVLQFTDRSTDSLTVASWKWHFSNGDSSSQQHPFIIYDGILNSITATLFVTSINGCTSAITKTFSFYKKPDYSLSPILTKCTSQSVQLDLNMNGNNIYAWSTSTDLDNPNIKNPTTSTPVNTTYFVTIKSILANGDTCVQFDSVQIQNLNTLQINANDTLKICNDSVRLSVPLSAGQTVEWSTSNSFNPVIGTTASIAIAQTNAIQKYYVRVSASGFCEAIDSVTAIYNDTIPTIDLINSILQCSNNINLNAIINFHESIEWSASPLFIPILSTNNSVSLNQNIKTVTYYIKANFRTCSNTDSVVVTIQDTIPQITLTDTLNICNDVVRLNGIVRNFTSIIWSTSPTFSPVIGTTPRININQTTTEQTYYIKAFYRDCERTDSVKVYYNDTIPAIQLDDSAFFCSNNVNINSTITNATDIVWSVNSNFVPVLSTQSFFSASQINPVQKYYVKALYRFCSVIDSITIRTQADLPQISLNDSVFVCADSVRINASVSNYDSLKWSADPTFTFILSDFPDLVLAQSETEKMYYLKVFKSDCEITDSIRVFFNDSLPAISLSSPNIFCSDSVFAFAFVDFYDEVGWYDSRDLSHLIGTNLTLQITQLQGEKWYYIKADYKFCSSIDSIKLDNRSIKYSPSNLESCTGDSLTINLNVQTASQYEIIWYVNGDTLETANFSTLKILPDSSQTLSFYIDNLYGCSIKDSLRINVNPLPNIDAIVDKPVIYIGEQVQLNATQNQTYSYNWTPTESISNAAISNPISSPTQTTLYTVVITDNNNCRNQDTVSVQVINYECEKENIYIPNAFTPNGDNVNDVFIVRSSILRKIHLEVYDRWGNKVFETDNLTDGWNGIYKNQPAISDSYGYYFYGECLQGEKITQKGNVTLLR